MFILDKKNLIKIILLIIMMCIVLSLGDHHYGFQYEF